MAPIYASETGNFERELAKGNVIYQCVLADIEDLGFKTVVWQGEEKEVHKVRFIWVSNTPNSKGEPFTFAKSYTLSLGTQANLRKDLDSIMNRKDVQYGQNFDITQFIGKLQAQLLITVETRRDNNKEVNSIKTCLAPAPGQKVVIPATYVSVANRPKKTKAEYKQASAVAAAVTGSAVPASVPAQASSSSFEDLFKPAASTKAPAASNVPAAAAGNITFGPPKAVIPTADELNSTLPVEASSAEITDEDIPF